jgi:heme/copper-type cytochrome/quinol oxidase subunit 2
MAILLLIAVVAGTLVSCGIGGTQSKGQDNEGDIDGLHWDYQRDNTTLTITGKGAMKNFASAAEVPWTVEAASATRIIIGEGVTSIGDYAFAFFSALESIKISSTVTSIGKFAFTASSIRTIDIPASVTVIGERAFEYCDDLKTVVVRGDVKELANETFSYCNSLTNVYLPEALVANPIVIKEGKTVTAKVVAADTPDASVPPVEETEPETEVPTDTDTADNETDTPVEIPENKFGVGTIIAIVALVVVVVGLIVGIVLFIRYDKKHSGNTTTVRKNKDEKGKKDGKKKK